MLSTSRLVAAGDLHGAREQRIAILRERLVDHIQADPHEQREPDPAAPHARAFELVFGTPHSLRSPSRR
jgi:hypothetical protein